MMKIKTSPIYENSSDTIIIRDSNSNCDYIEYFHYCSTFVVNEYINFNNGNKICPKCGKIFNLIIDNVKIKKYIDEEKKEIVSDVK